MQSQFGDPTTCEGYGASSLKTGAENFAAIQAALNNLGYVSLTTPGTYQLDTSTGPLIIKSGTYFFTAPGVVIQQVYGTNKKMLMNYAAQQAIAGVRTTVTLTWTSGVICNVQWTAHGKTANDYVCIQGAAQSAYWDVFRVHKVVDADNFQVRLTSIPSAAATGTIYGYSCDKDITIDVKGAFDYNWNNVGGTSTTVDIATNRHCAVLGLCGRLNVLSWESRNVDKYGFNTQGCADYRLQNVRGYNVAEIYKQYGPALNGSLDGLTGNSVDDCSTIQAQEPSAFLNYMIVQGNIHNITRRNINASNVTNGAMSFGIYVDDTYEIDNVKDENCAGYCENGNGAQVKYGTGFSTGKIGRWTLENFNGAGKASTGFGISIAANYDVITLIGPQCQWEDNAGTQLVKQESTCTGRSLVIQGFRHTGTTYPSTTTAYMFNLNGPVDVVEFRNCAVSMNTTFGRFFNVGTGAINTIILQACDFYSGSMIGNISAGASNTRTVIMNGCYVKSVGSGFDTRSLTRFILNGNTFDTMTSGVVRPTTTAGLMAQVYGTGNTFTSAAAVSAANSATWEAYSWDIAVDPITATNMATTNGQFCTSTQAGVESGFAVRANGQWTALGTGAAGANNLIT